MPYRSKKKNKKFFILSRRNSLKLIANLKSVKFGWAKLNSSVQDIISKIYGQIGKYVHVVHVVCPTCPTCSYTSNEFKYSKRWAHSGYPCGEYPDLKLAREAFVMALLVGERSMVDKGYGDDMYFFQPNDTNRKKHK